MLNIIKATLRQSRRDIFLKITAGYLLLMVVLSILGEEIDWKAHGSMMVGTLGMFLQFAIPIVTGVLTGRACGSDLRDKTANYEILFGKKRYEVYFGRFFASLIFMFVLVALIPPIPVLFMTIKNGWGASLAVSEALTLYGMLFPIVFRMVCFYTAITFFSGNDVVTILLSTIGPMVLILSVYMLKELDYNVTWQTAMSDLMRLLDFSNEGSGFFEGEDTTVYKLDLPISLIVRMICTSVGIGAAWLFGGYAIYRRRDIP